MLKRNQSSERRRSRVRRYLALRKNSRPRLSVFRSEKNIYAQIIDDEQRITLVSASSLEKEIRSTLKTGADCAAASLIGKLVAERAQSQGIGEVVFDRGGYIYHGRVKALAEAAREAGLTF